MWIITLNVLDGIVMQRTNFRSLKAKDAVAYAHNVNQLKSLGHRFQLADDDNEIYFEGYADSEEDMLNCLDDYGQDFGCTTVFIRSGAFAWAPLN